MRWHGLALENGQNESKRLLIMADKAISRKKILEFLRENHVDTKGIENATRYVYCSGKNQICDALAVGIMAGDFDE